MEKITDKVHKDLCKILENYDNKKDRTPETLRKLLGRIYNEWEYITKGI